MDTFTALDACTLRQAAVEEILGNAAAGAADEVRNACSIVSAAKSRDTHQCQPINAPSRRNRCQTIVAEVAGDPDACPLPVALDHGRDPVCVALASRDDRLCPAAADHGAAAACAAIATHSSAPCDDLPSGPDEESCVRAEGFWARVFPVPALHPPLDLRGYWQAAVSGTEENMIHGAWAFEPARGVVLVERADGTHITFRTEPDRGAAMDSADSSWIRGEIVVSSGSKRARVSSYEVHFPPKLRARLTSTAASALRVRVGHLEASRGGIVEFSVEGPVEEGVFTRAGLRTFVRDIVRDRSRRPAPP